jgi:hypothetical protein
MRRALVIFLILLFPLNVFALSMSVASMQQAGPSVHAAVVPDALDMPAIGDIDADEPPAGHDFHDSVTEAGRLQPAVLPDRLPPPHPSLRQGRAPVPPIKPPPIH